MSRIALALLPLMFSVPGHADTANAELARYESMTRVAVRCATPRSSTDIVVCGKRRADRWRVPYLLKDQGDPSIQNVPGERAALIKKSTPCQDRGPFLVGCGPGVGISTTIGFGSGTAPVLRPLAE